MPVLLFAFCLGHCISFVISLLTKEEHVALSNSVKTEGTSPSVSLVPFCLADVPFYLFCLPQTTASSPFWQEFGKAGTNARICKAFQLLMRLNALLLRALVPI